MVVGDGVTLGVGVNEGVGVTLGVGVATRVSLLTKTSLFPPLFPAWYGFSVGKSEEPVYPVT